MGPASQTSPSEVSSITRRFRPPAWQLTAFLICCAAFILIGLAMLTAPSQQVGGVSGTITGGLAVAFGCVMAVMRLTVDVTLTPAQISYRYNFRRRAIPWASVESFRVAPAPGLGAWSCVAVQVKQRGSVRIPIAGSRSYVQQMIGELEAYRAGAGEVPVTKR